MKIASATIELSASHDKQQSHQIRESLRIGQDRMRAIGDAGPRLGRPQVNISDAGKSAQSAEASAIESGSATIATVRPASRSWRKSSMRYPPRRTVTSLGT